MVDQTISTNKETNKTGRFWSLAVSLGLGLVAMALDFAVLGIYQYAGDTPTYVASIAYYAGDETGIHGSGDIEMSKFRVLKPVYGVIGSFMVPFVSPQSAILLINILGFLGTIVIIFFILKELGFTPSAATIGTTWFSFGYPVMKYGFSLITDMSGYFFIALTCYLVLIGYRERRFPWFVYAGVAAGIGGLSKETGVLGLSFVVGAAVANFKSKGLRFTLVSILLAFGSFALIYLPAQMLIMQHLGYTFFDFFNKTQHAYYGDYPAHLFYPLIHGATFHILWLYAAVGTIFWIKDKKDPLWIGAWAVGLPTVFWLMYVTRYAFVYFIAVIPFALYGLGQISNIFDLRQSTRGKKFTIALAVIPSIINMMLLCGAKSGTYLNFLLK